MKCSAMNRRDNGRIRQYMNIKEKSELEDDKHYEGKETKWIGNIRGNSIEEVRSKLGFEVWAEGKLRKNIPNLEDGIGVAG